MSATRFSRLLFVLVPAAVIGWVAFGSAEGRGAKPASGAAPPPAQAAQAQADYRAAMEQADLAIQKENREHSELMKNEEYLTTEIGPRLTGGKEMQAATAWTVKRFQDYGLEAHAEDATVPRAWYPGVDTAEIIAPWHKVIPIHAEAYSKTTCPDGQATTDANGRQSPACEITAEVVALTPGEPVTPDQLRGKVVLQSPPTSTNLDPDYVADNAYDSVIVPRRGVPAAGGRGGGRFGGRGRGAGGGPNPLADAVLVLRDGGKPWNLVSIGSASRGQSGFSDVPTAAISHEDYDLIYRMITDYGNTVRMRFAIRGTLSAGPEKASITVAQIKGTEKPDEQVIIGGHLDSWFLGQGAVDNGTGAMSVLEAARIIHALGWKPKRTLTFILFTGEEEGGLGVRTFIANHKAEMPKVDAVLVDDTGTGKFLSISMDGFWETAPELAEVYTPLQEVFDLEALDSRTFGSSDHVAFEREGIPAYFGVQRAAHYREEHHTQADTFDKVIADEVNQGAAVICAWMWNVSQLDEPFPHHAVTAAQGRGGGQ
jgi:carboxypeptidase Q